MTELENVITVRKTANIFGDTKIDGVVSVTHKIVDKIEYVTFKFHSYEDLLNFQIQYIQ